MVALIYIGLALPCRRIGVGEALAVRRKAVGIRIITGATHRMVGREREVNVAKEAGQPGEGKVRTLLHRWGAREEERGAACHDNRARGGRSG
jgi:hypothetical protein